MNKKEFNEWADNMVKRIDYKRLFTYKLPEDVRTIMCYDKRTGKVGVARCHPDDVFNLAWGKAIATARCLGLEVPKITEKKLSKMKYGEKFRYKHIVYVFLCKIPDCNCYAVREKYGKCRLLNFADILVKMVE